MIQGNLEYLMSSLPYLSFQDSEEERVKVASLFGKYARPAAGQQGLVAIFEEEARKFLSTGQFQTLKRIDLAGIHGPFFRKGRNRVLAAFSEFAYRLKKDVRNLRLARKNNAEGTATRKLPLPLIPGNPLDEEVRLMKRQWDKLEELSIGHYADFDALCIYKLKLLLLTRWWGFDPIRGFEKFERITEINA